jgi:hypothetical protein
VGEYTNEGFVVLKGSRGRVNNVTSIQGTSNERFRQQLAGVENRTRSDFGRRQATVGELGDRMDAIFS